MNRPRIILGGHAEMTMISVSDFIILVFWIPGKVRHRIKGAEHCNITP